MGGFAVGHADNITFYASLSEPGDGHHATRTGGFDDRLGSYLRAVGAAADQLPHPGLALELDAPSLADVYVPRRTSSRTARAPAAAEQVFTGDDPIRVLLAGPGHGKSTLLRQHLLSASRHLLTEEADPAASTVAFPVLIRAGDLVGAPLLAPALAHAVTEEYGPYGLSEVLTEDFFRHPPRVGARWLVMVDGLDEVPDRTARLSLLDRLAREAGRTDTTYRFLVATRPLPGGELDRLPRATDRVTLEPFTDDDVRTYVHKRLHALPDADRHVRAFLNSVRRTRLEELARIPLMTAMLCHLYEADTDRPLPDGRAGVFRSFVELLYEENVHKGVGDLHDRAIRTLAGRYQIPEDRRTVEQAAERAREHLPVLIDHLAHERINGNRAPATAILAAHPHARRPDKVKPPLWDALLASLLRSCGLLAGQGDDVEFLHRTLMEYHAARHATRDPQARTLLFDRLFPARRLRDRLRRAGRRPSGEKPLDPLDLEPSYLGFLLDALLASEKPLARATLRAMEDLFGAADITGYHLLKAQLQLGSSLPRPQAARWLTAFADSPAVDDRARVEAAWDLAELEGHLDDGARLLTRLAGDRALQPDHRSWAAEILAGLQGHETAGATLLLRLVEDVAPDEYSVLGVARSLARLDSHGFLGVQLLTECAMDPGTDDHLRCLAAHWLTELDGHRESGAALLLDLAQYGSVAAARHLSEMDGRYQEDGVGLLTAFAGDSATTPDDRANAAAALAEVVGYQDRAARLLTELARESLPGSHSYLTAAERLAEVDVEAAAELVAPVVTGRSIHPGNRLRALRLLARSATHQGEAAGLLGGIAADITTQAHYRIDAAAALVELDGHREEAVVLLLAIARDGGVQMRDRITAASELAECGEEGSAELLSAFATDPTAPPDARVLAARSLATLDGHRAMGLRFLAALAKDPGADEAHRRNAAASLTALDLYRIRR
ncbi:NACHT domain-containing protein [Streptomyces sp. NPDC059071]|uniref:NACHT domain-containing protein n=1 Tax=unclassified Streptomyces TaxID=2593676 RepID=UPI003655378C